MGFKTQPRSEDEKPEEPKTVEDWIVKRSALVTNKGDQKPWDAYDPNEKPEKKDTKFFNLRLNRYYHTLLLAIARKNKRSGHQEAMVALIEHIEKEMPGL